VGATAFVGMRVSHGCSDCFFEVALPPRRAGERTEVDDAN
jgi:hypothetical protein